MWAWRKRNERKKAGKEESLIIKAMNESQKRNVEQLKLDKCDTFSAFRIIALTLKSSCVLVTVSRWMTCNP